MNNHDEITRGDILISTEIKKLDINTIHEFLCYQSEWARGIPFEKVKRSVESSLNFGLYKVNKLIGYARVISDYSTIAYLGDIFILKEFRGLGLSKWLMEEIMKHPDLQGLRRWILLTSTADWLYRKYGFTDLNKPEIYMEKYDSNVYHK